MHVCLVRLPSPFLIDERCFPPLGLLSVGTALKLAGHDVTVFDGELADLPLDYSHYGFGPTIAEYTAAQHVKDRIRRVNPEARLVIGGPYATLNAGVCLDDGFDCVVRRDGEAVAAMAFTGKARLYVGMELPLDTYPIIDRSLLDIKGYRYILNGRLATTIMSSQGCPFRCGFCCKTYNTVRMRSVEHVTRELDYLIGTFGYQAVVFPDDLFILDKKRTVGLCASLKERGLLWRCLVRGDLVVKYGQEFVDMMRDSGCVEIGMGIESGSDKILKTVSKGESVATIKHAVQMLKTSGIRVKGFFIVGLPGETEDTLAETRDFLDEMQLDDLDVKIYQPYLGTPIWSNRDKLDIDWDDAEDLSTLFYKGRPREYWGTVRTSGLSTQQIYEAWVDMEAHYKHAC